MTDAPPLHSYDLGVGLKAPAGGGAAARDEVDAARRPWFAPRRRVITAYVGTTAVLTAVYYLLPVIQTVQWGFIGLTSVAAILLGVAMYRPVPRLPWYLLAAAVLAQVAGDSTYNVLTDVLGRHNPFPSAADLCYLVMYVLFTAALLGFIRRRGADRDRGSLLDALTLTAGVALLSWIYLIVPYAQDKNLPPLDRATSLLYPLGDVLVLAMLARLLTAGGTRARAVLLLALGTLTMLVFDVAYTLIQLNDGWQTGSVLDLGWIAFYVTCGAAALHPSMVLLTRPVAPRHAGIAPGRLGLLSLASLVAPGVLLLEAVQDDVRHAGVIAIFSAALFLLVLARLSGVVATHRQGVARERELRMAVASLVAATSIEQIARAVRGAAARLFGEQTKHTVVLVVGDGDELHPVRADPTEPAWRIRQPHEAHEAWLPVLLGEVRLVPADDLGPDLAAGLDGMPSALLCPLALRYRPSGDPLVGALVIVADEHDLARLRDTLETLAAQAALGVERVMLNQELNRRNSEAYFRTLVQNASDVIMILDDEDRVSYASPSATSMFGHKPLEGEGLTGLVSPQDRARVGAALESMRSSAEQHRRGDWRVTRSDGTTVELEARCSNLRRDPTVQGMVLTLRDVTDQRRLERELKHRAFHDSLTGLANRVLFQDRVEHALARARGKTAVVGVLFIDLDDFKVVNDTMGHGVGDELLVAVARRLSATVRAHDTAARLGGDEFAVLVEDATRPADVEVLAEHVVKAFAEPFRLSTGPVSVAASVGVATAMDSADADELLRHADLALYAAKGTGKSRWRRFQPSLHTGMVERHELRSGLDEAIAEATFTLRHQPIVELATGVVVGFEALLRWPHPQRGMVMPEAFIALAEETAHIVPLGAWVLEHALADAARWQHLTTPLRPLHIGVNVSARQFRDPGFVTSVQHALRTSGLDPALVMLELTESLLMRHDDRIGRDLHTLKDLGVHIAIDDFGTGYSSLSYLRQFPIDVLKIDKSFIDGMTDSPRQAALVEAIIRIAHTLELQAVAEGIETQTQRDLLATIGCPLGQGFLFSHPLPAAETEKLLRGQTRLGVPLGEPGPDEVRGRAG